MGFRQPLRRSTLADANDRRDWRGHAALAQRLITQARTLYVDEELGLDLTNTVYALDSTTIALCLSVFPWAHFRTTKAAVIDAHAARPAGQHSEFYSTSRMASCTYVHALDMLLAGRPEPSTSWIVATSTLPAFMCCTKLGPSSSRVPSRTSMLIASIRRRRIARQGIICDQTISLDGFYTRQDYPELLRRDPLQGPRVRGKTLVFITNNLSLPCRHHLRALQKPLAGGTLLQVDQAASSDQAVLRHRSENSG